MHGLPGPCLPRPAGERTAFAAPRLERAQEAGGARNGVLKAGVRLTGDEGMFTSLSRTQYCSICPQTASRWQKGEPSGRLEAE